MLRFSVGETNLRRQNGFLQIGSKKLETWKVILRLYACWRAVLRGSMAKKSESTKKIDN